MIKTMTKIWTLYKFASKLTWIGVIQAHAEKEAIEKGAEVFKVAANRLIANPTK
jgi:hypothetical protein